LGRHEVKVGLKLIARLLLLLLVLLLLLLLVVVVVVVRLRRRRVRRRPVGRPVRVVTVVVRRLLRRSGQRVRAGRPVVLMVAAGARWRWPVVAVSAGAVGRRRRGTMQGPRLGVMVAAGVR